MTKLKAQHSRELARVTKEKLAATEKLAEVQRQGAKGSDTLKG